MNLNKNLFLRPALESHGLTLEQYSISIGSYDRDVIGKEIASLKETKDLAWRTWLVVNYYITALVKFIKHKQGQPLDLDVEAYPKFNLLYHKAIERPWHKDTSEDLLRIESKAVAIIKEVLTIKRDRLADRLGIPAKEIRKLLAGVVRSGEIKQSGACYYV